MRLVVFFDLPMDTASHRRNYAAFRKYLVKNGYIMMQESVYSKLAINDRVADVLIGRLRRHRPPAGLVQVLKVTERQFASMVCIAGRAPDGPELNDTEGLVVL